MEGIGYFQNLRTFLRILLEFFLNFWGKSFGIFLGGFFGRIFLVGFFGEDFLGGFLGGLFLEEFFGRNYLFYFDVEGIDLQRF